MEVNHTRIYGVSHCPPLSEQPVTSKPNAFLGYVPESTLTTPATPVQKLLIAQNQNSEGNYLHLSTNDRYRIENDQPIAVAKPTESGNLKTIQTIPDQGKIAQNSQIFDPIQQGQQITKLASEIEELRSKIEKLSSQNELLLNQQFNKSVSTTEITTRPPNENLTEARKP